MHSVFLKTKCGIYRLSDSRRGSWDLIALSKFEWRRIILLKPTLSKPWHITLNLRQICVVLKNKYNYFRCSISSNGLNGNRFHQICMHEIHLKWKCPRCLHRKQTKNIRRMDNGGKKTLTIRCLDISSYDKCSRICSNIQSGISSSSMMPYSIARFAQKNFWFRKNLAKNYCFYGSNRLREYVSQRKLSLVLFLFASSFSSSSSQMTADGVLPFESIVPIANSFMRIAFDR